MFNQFFIMLTNFTSFSFKNINNHNSLLQWINIFLYILAGVFLICWGPFFTCNILDAVCTKMEADCAPGVTAFLLTTWLGYMNSFVNPVIYTIFNPEFRKAFKKLMAITT